MINGFFLFKGKEASIHQKLISPQWPPRVRNHIYWKCWVHSIVGWTFWWAKVQNGRKKKKRAVVCPQQHRVQREKGKTGVRVWNFGKKMGSQAWSVLAQIWYDESLQSALSVIKVFLSGWFPPQHSFGHSTLVRSSLIFPELPIEGKRIIHKK